MAPFDRPYTIFYVVPFSSYLTLNNRDLEIWVRGHWTFVVTIYIVTTSPSASRSDSASWSTSVCTTWHRHTCLKCAIRPARRTPSTALSDSRRPGCSKISTINVRQTGLLSRPDCIELFTGSFKNSILTIERFRRLLKSGLYSTHGAHWRFS